MIHIYHPNKSVKGFACSFWYSTRNDSVFATLIKQSGWNEKTQTGVFKDSLNDPTKRVNIKLSELEVSAILDCIERNRPFSGFHALDDSVSKTVSFSPWMVQPAADIDADTPAKPVQKGFSFTVNITPKDGEKNGFYIGLTYAEARYIREFLMHCLQKKFNKTFVREETSEAEPVTPPASNNESIDF